MNSVQTVTLNNALYQNRVGCTVRTPRTQVARALRAQCPCRGRCCSHSKQVARMSRACWACTCHDTPRQPIPRSRPHFDVATSRQPESCRDIKSMSRHRGSQKHVATSSRCRDATQNTPGRDLKTGSRHQTSCRQSTQVATSISCRDLTLTRPGRDLKSCRDLKSFSLGHHMNFMSRPRTLQS